MPTRTYSGRSRVVRPVSLTSPLLRAELAEQLRRRVPELEELIRERLMAVAGSAAEEWQLRGALAATVPEALVFAIASIEQDEGPPPQIPLSVVNQARRAVNGPGLGTVVRCCAAAERVLAELVADEARGLGTAVETDSAQRLGRAADRLLDAVSMVYIGELEKLRRSPSQRLSDLVHDLLGDAEVADHPDLGYAFEGWHVGLVVAGAEARKTIGRIARAVDRQSLVAAGGDGTLWAWLGGREKPAVSELAELIAAEAPDGARFAVGEARRGFAGWRLTHREAARGSMVMWRYAETVVRGKDVALLAAALTDEVLVTSLRETFLLPFGGAGEAGAVLRETVRAYLDSGGNAVAAAAALGVNRHTVQRRLRRIEDELGGPLHRWHAELKVALDLEDARQR